jgi:F0F1-type ATP synthase assembly protein I
MRKAATTEAAAAFRPSANMLRAPMKTLSALISTIMLGMGVLGFLPRWDGTLVQPLWLSIALTVIGGIWYWLTPAVTVGEVKDKATSSSPEIDTKAPDTFGPYEDY